MMSRKEYPISAMRFSGSVSIEDSGEDSPQIKMTARSGQPIEHWFWGRVVHDNSGAKFGDSIPLDYCHDDKEVVGFANADGIGIDSEHNLSVSGTMTPFAEGDRANEILAKAKMGVPYQASINFAGDGIKIQNLKENEKTSVNGYEFNGPGVVIREWPLRGVAICPYGADSNTASEFKSSEVISVTVLEGPEMDNQKNEASEAVSEEKEIEAIDVAETLEAVEPVEALEEVAVLSSPAEVAKKFSKAFGNELCGQYLSSGLTFEEAQLKFSEHLKDENERLKAEVAHLKSGDSVAMSGGSEAEAPKEEPAKGFFSTIKINRFSSN